MESVPPRVEGEPAPAGIEYSEGVRGLSQGRFLAVLGVMLWCIPSSSWCEHLSPMYTEDGVRDLFDSKISLKKAPDLVLLRPKPEKIAKKDEPHKDDSPPKSTLKKPEEELSPKEKLLKEFGDPSERQPVRAKDDAPAPFKALIAALDAGERDLAFRYAVQYSRYVEDLQSTIDDSVALGGIADVREGTLPPNSWPMDEKYAGDHHFLTDPLEAEEEEPGDDSPEALAATRKLQVEKLLSDVEKDRYALFQEEANSLSAENLGLNEEKERQRARSELSRSVPRNPNGQVQILLFLKPYDTKALAIGSELERLYQESLKEEGVSFMAFSIDSASNTAKGYFKKRTKTTFPINASNVMAKNFGIKESPTLIFISPKTGAAYTHVGIENGYYLSEIKNLMRGSVQ